jgi:hypothetical protein
MGIMVLNIDFDLCHYMVGVAQILLAQCGFCRGAQLQVRDASDMVLSI